MSKRALLILGVIVLCSVTPGFFMLTRGHPWWDDFAGYLLQTRSILAWNMGAFIRANTFTVETSSYPPGPVAYPWGFPLLLAPVYALFGLNALALKLVNLVFYALFLVWLALLARTRLNETDALLLAGFFGFSPSMLAANDLIQSDVAFLAFSTASLVLIDSLPRKKTAGGFAAGAAIFMAFFVRTNGVLLLAPLLLTVIIATWPDWKSALKMAMAPLLTFAVLASLQALLFPGGQASYLSHFTMFTPARLLDNILYYFWLPALVFDQLPGKEALYLLMLAFALVSLALRLRRDATMHTYGLLTVLLFIAWPERQGLRFIYPVLPFFFVAALDGMRLVAGSLKTWQSAGQRLVSGLWVGLLLVCLGISAVSAWQITSGGREINGPFDAYSYQMYQFVREKTPADSIMIFMRPRALSLFTGRQAFMTDNCADLGKGNYAVISLKSENGQVPPDQVTACNPAVTLEDVFRNRRFVVYKIKP